MTDLIVGIISLIGALFLGIGWGARRASKRHAAKDAEAYRKSTEELDDAEASAGTDPDLMREWLRERGKS